MSYTWSWCPVTLGSLAGYDCAVDEDQVREAMEDNVPGSSALLPSFDLGTEPTAAFSLDIPAAALSALCETEIEVDIEGLDLSDLFSCDEGLSITIRLDVATDTEQVSAVKEVLLLTEDASDRNENPSIGSVFLADDGGDVEIGQDAFVLTAESWHDLRVSVPSGAAQSFTPAATDDDPDPEAREESLFMTWFVTGGETEAQRTTYIEDEVPMETLENNSWRTPAVDETADGSARFFLVLQDERGGVTWTERRVTLEER